MRTVTSQPSSPRHLAISVRNVELPEESRHTGDFRDTLRARWEHARREHESENLMARLLSVVPKSTGALVPVPDEVAEELDKMYDHLQANPQEVGHAKFDTEDELKEWVKQAKSWAQGRDDKPTFRQLKSNTLPENEIRFSITAPLTEDEKTARAEANAKRKTTKK